MSSIASRARAAALPDLLAWRALGFRTVCTGRLGFAPSDPDPPVSAGTKVLETFKEEFEIGSRVITLETGKIARFANGSVVLGMDETKVLSTVTCAKNDSPSGFLPLTVDYQEKQYAQGVIPNSYMRREGAPKERELLCGRLIDRPIRPLFPPGFYHEVQVMASVLSSDGKQDPDVMAANATSAALMLSDIPWGGPIGVIRIGRICGQFIINPTMDELSSSDLNLVYACTRDKTMMIDVQAREISEKDLEAALRLAHPEAVKYLEPQIRLAGKAGKQKKEYRLSLIPEKTLERVGDLAASRIESIFTDPSYGKFERGEALDNIAQDVKKVFEAEGDEESLKVLPKAVDTVRKKVVRARMISDGFRVDGRQLDEVRPIYCESGHLRALHGSAIFSRGDTQVLCTVTLGAPGEAQRLDSLVGPPRKRFMLHYSFPPFCTNEVGKRGGLNRREVGHGTLAEKALLAVLPPEEDFPYVVRINSEVMASDGSTSMASVCGGSMALMDAGIPLRRHVAGISVGLVTDIDPLDGEIKDYRIVTDILGLEDHLGDMDFKIAGTRDGVTAIQLDIKPAGIPLDIVCESLEHGRKGRLQILDHMEQMINAPRARDDVYSPQIATLRYANDSIRQLVGPMGVLIRKIEEETGARLSVGDGTLTIVAKNRAVMEKVQEKIDFLIGREIEVGGIYKGRVTALKDYGAFVEFNGGQQGLLHVSELSHDKVSKVSDVLSIGQQLSMRCIGTDVHGHIKLSLKAMLPRPRSDPENLVKESFTLPRETSDYAQVASIPSNVEDGQKSRPQNLPKGKSSATPAVVIRSVAECDEAEKSVGLDASTENNRKPSMTLKQSHKLKSTAPKDDTLSSILSDSKLLTSAKDKKITPQKEKESDSEADNGTSMSARKQNIPKGKSSATPAVVIRSAAECDEAEKSTGLDSNTGNKTKLKQNRKLKSAAPKDDTLSSILSAGSKLLTFAKSKVRYQKEKEETDSEAQDGASLSAQKLKIGTAVTAKVSQIRARGLVLDLGGGIRGMYKFEDNEESDFKVGETLRVKCMSFSTKGIPIMSLVEED